MSEGKAAADEFSMLILEAIEKGQQGDYALCAAIVDAFRESKGEEKARAVRRVLWKMIKDRT